MPSREEFFVAVALVGLLLALKLVHVLRYRFDTDESAHLHVIWAWTRGLVQYRDIFDNHMPLFHILLAPIFGLIGDRPSILYWMRFILLPTYFVAAWATYQIGAVLFSRRAGIWGAILAGLCAPYYFQSLEFRTDNLWAALWLLSIVVMICGTLSVRRGMVAGLLLGLCFGVSMKSTLFLLSFSGAAILALLIVGRDKLGTSWAQLVQITAAWLMALASVPIVIMIFFWSQGVWRDFRYCVFDFNFLATAVYEHRIVYRNHPILALILVLGLLGIVCLVRQGLGRRPGNPQLVFRRSFIVSICVLYFLAIKGGIWLLSSRSDFLPFYPLVFAIGVGTLLGFHGRLSRTAPHIVRIFRFAPVIATVAVLEIFALTRAPVFWKDGARRETNLLRDVLRLTEPEDYILDCKGETIFRRRCLRPTLETITIKLIRNGRIPDEAPRRCIETGTCVAATILMRRFPPETRRFIEHNYLPVTRGLRVAGLRLQPSAASPKRFDFDVVIPASYRIISRHGDVSGMLDGTAYEGRRFLTRGSHTFESTSPSANMILLWARAADRHFTPFEDQIQPDS